MLRVLRGVFRIQAVLGGRGKSGLQVGRGKSGRTLLFTFRKESLSEGVGGEVDGSGEGRVQPVAVLGQEPSHGVRDRPGVMFYPAITKS